MRFAGIIALAATLVACSTPYRPSGLLGGFSERQLAGDTYLVSFEGNGYTSDQQARDFLLLRCADLTLGQGSKFFRLVGSAADSKDGAVIVANGGAAFAAPIHFPNQTATIQLRADREGPQDFDAAIVADSMRKAYGIK